MTPDTAVSLGVLVALVGCFVGLAGWLSARDKRTGDDREWRGAVNAKLDVIVGIKTDVERIEKVQGCHAERIARVEASSASAHKRLDEHLKGDGT